MSWIDLYEVVNEYSYYCDTTSEYRQAVRDLSKKYPQLKRGFLDKWTDENFVEMSADDIQGILGDDPYPDYNWLQKKWSKYTAANQNSSIRFRGGIHWRDELAGNRIHLDAANSMTFFGGGNIGHMAEAFLSDRNSAGGIGMLFGNMIRPWASSFYQYRYTF